MKTSSWLRLASLLALSTQIAAYGITGVSGGVNTDTGERPSRRELREFQTSGPAFDLFIQALSQWQADDQSDMLSYYEIAGIHGYPFRSWDGVDGQYQTGYCTHGSPIFPVWHRPYVAMVEERVWSYAQNIANSYPDDQRQTYIDAATTLRFPYWDWAVNPTMPDCLMYQDIQINTPTGQQSMTNPLYSYKFHPLPLGTDFPNDGPLATFAETVRSPDPTTGQSRMDNVNSGMSSNSAWLTSTTYQLLSSETNYTVFSNAVLKDRGDNYNNLESLHDGVHALIGDGGHMTYLSMAAFDPIFWIHHSSVDRIFALWEVLNPDSYVQPLPDAYGTFVVPEGTVEDINTPLYPFHRSDDPNDFWTSDTARSTRTFGYTYPEIQDWGVDQGTLQNNVRAAVNNLYNAPARMSPVKPASRKQKRDDSQVQQSTPGSMGTLATNAVTGQMTKLEFDRLGVNNLPKNWAINVAVDKHALNGNPFQIHFFYGSPANQLKPSQYFNASNLIGTYRIFSSPKVTSDGDQQHRRRSSFDKLENEEKLSTGQISLSPLLANAFSKGVLPDNSLTSEDVTPILTKNLQWRVTTADTSDDASSDGVKEVPVKDLADKGQLRVAVVSRDVEPIQAGEEHLFPRYGEWVEWEDVTKGKVGGL